jgi:hypothetical protein
VVLERPLSFCGLVTAIDPNPPDDVCKRYGGFMINKLSVEPWIGGLVLGLNNYSRRAV